ncbi:MAG: phosphotransferase family protein, partial [Candidatus Binataceae bacterium]
MIGEPEEQALNALVRAKTGDDNARAHSLETLPGHAGFSYSFVLERMPGAEPAGKLVLRIAPPNVKIAGPADIMRQARIMLSLADSDVPVPQIYWYGDEPEFFARPYFVAAFLDGFKISDASEPPETLRSCARIGVETLVKLHTLPWEPRRHAFGQPVALNDEMKRLDYLLDRPTLDPAVVARAPELRERLRASLPRDARVGCVHGDFQWANVLFSRQRALAVIDWEIALTGPTLLDLGWLCFFSDPASWVETATQRVMPLSAEEIVEIYAAAARFDVSTAQVKWFRAFAGYRFGVITCFNLMLHRRGKRDDPHWEEVALSAPRMFEHALDLL